MRLFGLYLALIMASCSSIKTVNYEFKTPLFAPKSKLTIVHIADLHSTVYENMQQPLIEKIKNAKPDIVVLTGDIIDDVRPVFGTTLLLEGIKTIAPIYYVTGNHEYMSGNIEVIRTMLKLAGVQIISDSYINLNINGNKIILAGVEDPYKAKFEDPQYKPLFAMQNAFINLKNEDGYKILLAHRPEHINDYLKYDFDLILSGHTHGGQVRLPFVNGVYVPFQGLFPKYGGGLYQHKKTSHIISRGLSVYTFVPRIFNPPELVIITIFDK